MKLLGWRGGVLRQFWSSFAIVLVLNQVAILGGIYQFLVKPAVASFSTLTMALIDAGYRQQYAAPTPALGLGVLTNHWVSGEQIVIVSGEVPGLQPLPPYPGLRMIGREIEAQLGAQARVGFKTEPEQMLWIQYQAARPFAVGVGLLSLTVSE